jgi:hypothetical protein
VIRALIICLVIETRSESFFRLRLMRARIGLPGWMQHFGTNLFCPMPASARISLRAMRRAEVKVNGVSIQLPLFGNV